MTILTEIKKVLGIAEEYTQFDADIILYINAAFSTLKQLGVGPDAGFSISDDTAEWDDFVEDVAIQSMVKAYISLKVKLMFDLPANSFTQEAIKKQIDEYVWRLMVEATESEEESDE